MKRTEEANDPYRTLWHIVFLKLRNLYTIHIRPNDISFFSNEKKKRLTIHIRPNEETYYPSQTQRHIVFLKYLLNKQLDQDDILDTACLTFSPK